jgi:hypothetical protein
MSFVKQLHKSHYVIENVLEILGCICDQIEFEEEMHQDHLRQALEIAHTYMTKLYKRKEQYFIDWLEDETFSTDLPDKYWVGLITERGRVDNQYKRIIHELDNKKLNNRIAQLELVTQVRNYITSALRYLQISHDKHIRIEDSISDQQQQQLKKALDTIEQEVNRKEEQQLVSNRKSLEKIYLS